jgi:hypothetical protein
MVISAPPMAEIDPKRIAIPASTVKFLLSRTILHIIAYVQYGIKHNRIERVTCHRPNQTVEH